MKNARNYFEKTKKIYGLSTKYEFGKWHSWVRVFDNFAEAEKWLCEEESDFRERELVSLTTAKKWGYKQSLETY